MRIELIEHEHHLFAKRCLLNHPFDKTYKIAFRSRLVYACANFFGSYM